MISMKNLKAPVRIDTPPSVSSMGVVTRIGIMHTIILLLVAIETLLISVTVSQHSHKSIEFYVLESRLMTAMMKLIKV